MGEEMDGREIKQDVSSRSMDDFFFLLYFCVFQIFYNKYLAFVPLQKC